MKRTIFASKETEFQALTSRSKKVKVYSFFPCDKANCPCQKMIFEWKQKIGRASQKERQELLSKIKHLECPRDKVGMQRYEVVCTNCGELQGVLWATDPSLRDWCDFHYIQWSDGVKWHGCFTPHISPITQELLFECCCGNDTRDFRANMTMNRKRAEEIEKENAIGRKLNRSDSKFIVRKFRGKVLT
jgi:hypothetical protein